MVILIQMKSYTKLEKEENYTEGQTDAGKIGREIKARAREKEEKSNDYISGNGSF